MESVSPLLEPILQQARIKQFPQGQIILYEGDSPAEVYIVKSGYVKVYDIDKMGNEKILSIVKPLDIMPYSFFSGGDILNKWFYQSINDAEIYVLDRETLLRAMREDGTLTLLLVGRFSREVHELLTRISSMGKSRTVSRLTALLKYFVVCIDTPKDAVWWQLPFPVNQQFLADITGMTRESCAAAMKILTTKGIVRFPKLSIMEINTEKLSRLS